jgi:hypothetical protein
MVNPTHDPPSTVSATGAEPGSFPPRARERPESHGGSGESDWLGSYLLCEEGFGFGGIGFVPRVRFFGGFGFGRIGFSPDVFAMSQI